MLNKKPKNPNEVVFWTLQLSTFSNYLNPIIKEFEQQNPDIKIKWIDVPYSEGEKRTLASVLSNNPPDLINLTPDFSITLAQKGALAYIDKKYDKFYIKEIMDTLKYGDNYFALPFYATSAITIYNKSLLEKSGIKKVPKTYDEIISDAPKIKQNTNVWALMPVLIENDTFLKILNKYNINSPETIMDKKSEEIFEQYKSLYQNDLIPKESLTQTHREALEKYMAGKIVFLSAGANFLNLIKENSPNTYSQTDVAHQLAGDSKKYDFSLMNLIIPLRAKNQEGAIKFALFLTNKKNQLEFARLSTILPVNKEAINDNFFTTYKEKDLISKARFLSAKQLNNLQKGEGVNKNQKEIIKLLNETTQEIMLNKVKTKDGLEDLAKNWKLLIED